MKIPVCHHYWDDKENATWRIDGFYDRPLLKKINDDYLELATEKPAWRRYGDYTVFCSYRTTEESTGRRQVNISFAFVRNCEKPADMARIILPALLHTSRDTFSIELPDEKQDRANRGKRLIILIGALFILLVIVITSFIFSTPAKKDYPQQAAGFQMDSPYERTGQPSQHSLTKSSTQSASQKSGQSTLPHSDSSSKICGNTGLMADLRECPGKYMEAYCKDSGLTYERWQKKETNCKSKLPKEEKNIPRYLLKEPDKYSQEIRQELIDIFKKRI